MCAFQILLSLNNKPVIKPQLEAVEIAITHKETNADVGSEGSCLRLPQCSQVFVNPTNKHVYIFSLMQMERVLM